MNLKSTLKSAGSFALEIKQETECKVFGMHR